MARALHLRLMVLMRNKHPDTEVALETEQQTRNISVS